MNSIRCLLNFKKKLFSSHFINYLVSRYLLSFQVNRTTDILIWIKIYEIFYLICVILNFLCLVRLVWKYWYNEIQCFVMNFIILFHVHNIWVYIMNSVISLYIWYTNLSLLYWMLAVMINYAMSSIRYICPGNTINLWKLLKLIYPLNYLDIFNAYVSIFLKYSITVQGLELDSKGIIFFVPL